MACEASQWQDTFPVLDAAGKLVGLLSSDAIRTIVREDSLDRVALAADMMAPPVTIGVDDDLHEALEVLLESGLRELPVVDETGSIVGLLDESDVTKSYHDLIERHAGERRSEVTIVPMAE